MSNNEYKLNKRTEINTPIVMEEKQHVVRVFGNWFSVFSYVGVSGKRRFKCRKSYGSEKSAYLEWSLICENYS
tara:strand:+ start:25 stop:243 length:219 start_codon:yes stop_codon:yes gene_type:complete